MATNLSSTLTHLFGQAAEKYVLMAILAGIIAGLSAWLNLGVVITYGAIAGAIIAGLSAASAQFSSTGSIPGTRIPIATLLQLGYGALIAVLPRLAGITQFTTPAILAAVVLFLGTLLSEVQATTPPPNPVPNSTPAAAPSAPASTGGTS